MAVRIISDTTCDFGPIKAKEYGVELVPLKIQRGESVWRDGIDISTDEFYALLKSGGTLPVTSQPSPADFEDALKKLGDAEETVIITISRTLSGTYQSATIAKDTLGYRKAHVFSTDNATMGHAIFVERAVEMAAQGADAATILEELESYRGRVKLFAMINDLNFLHKGGRLSGAGAFVGGLLNVKPIIGISADGKIEVIAKARGVAAANKQLIDYMKQYGVTPDTRCLFGDVDCGANVHAFADEAIAQLGLTNCEFQKIGAVIAVHGGPGAYGVAFLGK